MTTPVALSTASIQIVALKYHFSLKKRGGGFFFSPKVAESSSGEGSVQDESEISNVQIHAFIMIQFLSKKI